MTPTVLREKPVKVPVSPPLIPQQTCLESKPGLRGERPAINRKAHIRTRYPLNASPPHNLLCLHKDVMPDVKSTLSH
jgi:hypothetical protein